MSHNAWRLFSLNSTHLSLPYPVDEENGSAKFDKSKRQLIVTLPVLPPPMPNFQVQTVGGFNAMIMYTFQFFAASEV